MKNLTVIILSGLLIILFNGCGGGSSGGDATTPPPDPNTLLSGEYQIHKLEYEGNNVIVDVFDGSADGQGNVNAAGHNIVYSIADDRTVSFKIPASPTVEDSFGKISSDGNMAVMTEAQYIDANNQDDVETLFLVKKSTTTAMTLDRLSGTYIISEAGADGGIRYTTQVEVILNNDGSGEFTILEHSVPAVVGNSDVFTYTVNANGTFTVNGIGTGIVSPDANVFVLSDGDNSDDNVFFSVGIRTSSSAPDLTGGFEMHFIGYDVSNPYPEGPQFAARYNIEVDQPNSEFDATCVVDSRGSCSSTAIPIPYKPLNPDGTFVAGSGDKDNGMLSPDGRFMTLVETETGDPEIKLGLAIK